MVTKKRKHFWLKNLILCSKSSKNHNLQKWTSICSIFTRFRDMRNSLNAQYYDMIEFWEKCRPISKIHNLQKWALCISIFNRFGTWEDEIIFLVILLVKFKSRHALPPGSCAESTREHEVRTAIAAAIVFLYGSKSVQQLFYGLNILEVLKGCPQEN